ncbi:IS1595 family transposase [Ferruginibacter sp.]|uniref:IS1595 family transposase n=1 Tax=Ferruginibacter sp. TaxID=1940288 RepID=UPI00374CFAFC
MNISNFFSQYSTEAECRRFFKSRKEQAGIVCSTCGSLVHYWIEKESRWKCQYCGKSMSLKSGTVMEHSNLGYKVWLWGLYFMSLTKKGFSALEMQRLLNHSRYESIWLMMQKIRIMMGQRDEKYDLDGFIEMDEGFFEGHRKKDEEGLITKPAKELDRQVKAIVAVSTTPIVISKHKKGRPVTKPGYLKISIVESLCKTDIAYEAEKMLAKTADVTTDGKTSYRVLKGLCKNHRAIVVADKKEVSKIFPWVHTAISNAKKKILGLHHSVKNIYMQNYLNEFCYKFNRRYFGIKLFDRLILAALEKSCYGPIPKSE